ncbi:AAA family ATPase [Micrococcales bacterium 31B]|nr:AAA family ATPase [Micrococcales bacterium 31B]
MTQRDYEIQREQHRVSALYARLDDLIEKTETRLRTVQSTNYGSTHQNRSERDAFAARYQDRLAQLQSVEHQLTFGRIDARGPGDSATGGETHYVGRIGLTGDDGQQQLVDWRAPAAAPFYQATASAPMGVARRRHLTIRSRRVTDIEDDVLDLDLLDDDGTVQGEGALLQALNAQRSGRMSDIVATIQGEQDRIIRAETRGVLVVQGGPGTGKTAVALHRAAYLLYTQRERLDRAGVLLVGPNAAFLKYIEKVLPSLGETGVVMATLGSLLPGVHATRHDDAPVAEVKGNFAMVRFLHRAVEDRQKTLEAPRELVLDDGTRLTLRPQDVAEARNIARSTRKPHNEARVVFVREMLARLVRQWESKLREAGVTVMPDDRSGYLEDLRTTHDVRVALNLLWMPLAPVTLLDSLFSKPRYLRSAARALRHLDASILARPAGSPLTVEDIPLLDELAELLGTDDEAERAASRRLRDETAQLVEYAENVVQNHGLDTVSAEMLAARVQAGATPGRLTAAERAANDRTWAFGHVVLDEAQELSAMQWRVLFRRCPSKSMTIVGDIAQTSTPAGARSWSGALHHYVQDRLTVADLTVNYRTPRQISAVADRLLADNGVRVRTPRAVREGTWPVTYHRLPEAADVTEWGAALDAAVARSSSSVGGRVAVIATAGMISRLRGELETRWATRADFGSRGLDTEIAVLTPQEAKGLEFDAVVIAEPQDLCDAGPRGINDLYVAMTRPTQRLDILYARRLPAGLGEA